MNTPRYVVQAAFLLIVLLSSAIAAFSLQSQLGIPSHGSIYYRPEAKALFKDGFETGNFNAWNGTYTTSGDSATVTAATPYEGAYAGRFVTSQISSGTKCAYAFVKMPQSISEVYARAYFYIANGLPLDDNGDRFGLISFEVGGQLQATFRVYRSNGIDRFNVVGLNAVSTAQESTDTIYPVEGQWFSVEFYIKVHSTEGEYRAWVNGVERITITGLDTARYGLGVTRVRVGLSATINVQHQVQVGSDCVAMSTRHIGQVYTFGIVGSSASNPAIRNFYWLFGNQSIRYGMLLPSEVRSLTDIALFDGLIVWTKQGGYNTSAVKQFARTRVVLSDIHDFADTLYTSLSGSTAVVATDTVTYVASWGSFSSGDLVEIRNETGSSNNLMAVTASGLASFANITTIARYDSTRIAYFHMNGTSSTGGFYVMDLDATTPETEWTGIWHVFPAIKMVKDFPTGKYAFWMANGQKWWNLTQIYNRIDEIVSGNGDIARKGIIGHSVQDRDIIGIAVGKGSRYAIIDGSLHGNEKTGTFACLRIAELLIEYYRYDPYWASKLNEYTVIVIPVINPDGFVLNTRENANGVDLNTQFPPDGVTTEPEAWALRNLMGNYTPTVYINFHEGWYWYPLELLCGNYESGIYQSLTIQAMQQANTTLMTMNHWGWFTENGMHVWLGKVDKIAQGGKLGMAISYASYEYKASCMLVETFLWSPKWGARKSLWGIDSYTAIGISFIRNLQR